MIRVEASESYTGSYHWYLLILATLTNCVAAAVPNIALSVLFAEISAELGLNLVQVGAVWGIGSLTAIVTALAGGMIIDRIGPRKVVMIGAVMVGLTGALRGLAADFGALLAAVLFMGLFAPSITISNVKNVSMWFPRHQLGFANGMLSMGMALGFLLSSLLSASWLSPLLGGWRYVLFLYGAMALLMAVPWAFVRVPSSSATPVQSGAGASLFTNLGNVLKVHNVLLLGLAILGIGGCVQGVLGYLPLHLRGLGWEPARADSALAVFHTVSLVCAIPIALASDRLGSRKRVLGVGAAMIILGVAILSAANGAAVWIAVCIAGMVRDGFMAVFMVAVTESEGLDPNYTATALGVAVMFSGLGGLIAPALGNSLAAVHPGLPFVLWASMAAAGLGLLLSSREKRKVPRTP